MAKYLYRSCPKCDDFLGVVVPEPPEPVDEIPIDALDGHPPLPAW